MIDRRPRSTRTYTLIPYQALDRSIGGAGENAPRNEAELTVKGLGAYQAKERPAVCTSYRVYKVCGMGAPSSGATTVFGILGMVEGWDMKTMGKEDRKSTRLNSSH